MACICAVGTPIQEVVYARELLSTWFNGSWYNVIRGHTLYIEVLLVSIVMSRKGHPDSPRSSHT